MAIIHTNVNALWFKMTDNDEPFRVSLFSGQPIAKENMTADVLYKKERIELKPRHWELFTTAFEMMQREQGLNGFFFNTQVSEGLHACAWNEDALQTMLDES